MRRERAYSVENGIETTAIDSGTIWTTERVVVTSEEPPKSSDSSQDRDYPVYYVGHTEADSVNDAGRSMNRSYDLTPPVAPYNIPRPSYTANRHRSEVSDEFRFLDDRASFPTKLGRFYYERSNSFRYRKHFFISLAILQIVLAIAIFVFAVLRYKRVFDNTVTDLLLDFLKAEDFASSNNEGTSIIAMKVGAAAFIPCIMQFLGGLCGLFPFFKRPPRFLVVLNLVFTAIALKQWFEPIILVIFELNLRNVQLEDAHTSAGYRLLITAIVLLTILIVFVHSAVIIHAAAQMGKKDDTHSSLFDLHVNLVTVVLSIIVVGFSAHATSNSLTDVTGWTNFGLRNQAALYGFGLRELLISGFVFFVSIFGSFAAIIHSRELRFGAMALQITSILIIFQHLLTGDRILAVSHNIDKMFRAEVTTPFSAEIPLLLYVFVVLMSISLIVLLVPTALNVFRQRAYDYYETSYAIPRTVIPTPALQRSAL
uniref:TRP domain-containing protein n=1 Tax=Panagrellus redivivus TaxID=6233 RepID=A0A7E4W4U0_PANRE